jgi:transcriptional regulator with XRE-family HTH domain
MYDIQEESSICWTVYGSAAAMAIARGSRLPRAAARPAAAAPPRIGETLQRLRLARRMSLEQLSRVAGVSKSMLSEIERDKANPTIAVAWRLANALGLSLNQLFGPRRQEPEAVRVQARHDRPTLAAADEQHVLRILGPMELAGRFEWYDLSLRPGGALESEGHDPGTMEHLTVLAGAMEVTVGAATKRVKAGETARYRADHGHGIVNPGSATAHALLVVVHGGP